VSSPDASTPGASGDRKEILAIFAGVAILLLGIVGSVRRPPVLDLAQQLEQASLFQRWLAGSATDLVLDLTGPNRAGTAIAIAIGGLAPAAWAPRVVLAAMVLLWCGAMLWIVVAGKRDPWAGALACVCLLASPFYSGFLNFLAGMLAFAFWVWEIGRDPAPRSTASLAVATAIGTAALYLCHGLWLLFGALVVGTFVLCARFSWKELAGRALGALPVAGLALAWRDALAQGGWQSNVDMRRSPLERLANWNEISTLFVGGIHGPWEKLFLGLVLVWLLLGLLAARRSPDRRFDRFLVLAALFALAWAIFLPDKLDRTVLFAWRWGPIAIALLLLAFPAPFASFRLRGLFASLAIAALALPTWFAWIGFEREEMAGFEESLAAIPRGSTIAGLDFVRRSPRFKNAPRFQMFAYASVERGARINFSFSEVASSIVRRRPDAAPWPWTQELDIYPQYFSLADFRHFDFLLVTANEEFVSLMQQRLGFVERAAGREPWQLIAVDREGAARSFDERRSGAQPTGSAASDDRSADRSSPRPAAPIAAKPATHPQ
jgi:hypothetical protein